MTLTRRTILKDLSFTAAGLLLDGSPFSGVTRALAEDDESMADFPPGWLPIHRLGDDVDWSDFRKIDDKVHLYLPPDSKAVRGVFACFVFHSADPRELARLWNFALVTVPWPFEYDLGINDKRNGRYQVGHAMQNMGLLLRYLGRAAEATKRPELAAVPIVGWLGQNGSHFCADLERRAPDRVLAWSDSFPDRLRHFPEMTARLPFAFAWEISKSELKDKDRKYKAMDEPLADLSCRANTYGFGHGIYSKYNFFTAFLDRCIRLRMPDEMPPAGEPVKLKKVVREEGWLGDFDPIGEWSPIAPANSSEAASMKYPSWLPDEYAAWMWRSYHSAQPDIRLTAPLIEYSKRDGKWGGPQCGMGYGGYLSADEPIAFAAETDGDYEAVVFYDGNRKLGEAGMKPWTIGGVRLEPGLHALFAAGVTRDGSIVASRPAFGIVR
jgi:hypothetical protein